MHNNFIYNGVWIRSNYINVIISYSGLVWSTIIGRQFAYEYARHSLLLVKLVYRRLLNPTIHPHRSPRHRRTRVACVAACSTAVLSSHSTLPSTALQTGGDSAAGCADASTSDHPDAPSPCLARASSQHLHATSAPVLPYSPSGARHRIVLYQVEPTDGCTATLDRSDERNTFTYHVN